MKIVYFGRLGRLKEGFEKLGHEIFVLHLEEGKTLSQQLEDLCPHPDLVVLEFFSDPILPKEICDCTFPIAAYFIDAPLNSFWQIPLSYLFDYIFVDQLSSQKEFEAKGIRAVWLPLCACENDFRNQDMVQKKFFCSFVGTVNKERIKRYNLLEDIKSHREIDQFSGINNEHMLDIFSQSHVTLNENLFNGLTLRVFQGLATGCLVLTEKMSLGTDIFFEDGKHLVYYEPSNILDKLDTIKENPEYWCRVALAGQKECRNKHMSEHRVQSLLMHVESSSLYFSAKTFGKEALLYEAEANYMFCLRFGGSYYNSMAKCFPCMQSENDLLRVRTKCLFAKDVISRTGDLQEAIELLEPELTNQTSPHIFLLLSQIYQEEKKYGNAFNTLNKMVSLFPEQFARLETLCEEIIHLFQLNNGIEGISAKIWLLLSHCYAQLGLIDQVGFTSCNPNAFYENATFCAIQAWETQPSSVILETLFLCAERGHYYEGELLPYFLEGVKKTFASDSQIVRTAELALSNYQKELSQAIIVEFRNYLKNRE